MKYKDNQFCGECGNKLKARFIGAEKYVSYDWGEAEHPYQKFSTKTGKRLVMKEYFCPNKRWFNNHTEFTEDKFINIKCANLEEML